jgi:hypothetical protein
LSLFLCFHFFHVIIPGGYMLDTRGGNDKRGEAFPKDILCNKGI